MKVFTRLFWSGALILILISAACAPGEETNPTPFETTAPLETDTASGAETATTGTVDLTGTAPTSETLEVTDTATTSGTAVGSPTSDTLTPGIPITGVDITIVDCQFCVGDLAHALLIMPDTNSFQVVSTSPSTTSTTNAVTPTCTTVEVNNGQQVVLCSGPESTTLMVNVCTSSGTCADVPVDLMECPEVPGSGTDAATNTPGTVPGAATATPSPSGLGTATVTPTP